MGRGCYAEINLHVTWHTKHNAAVIREAIRDRLYHYLHNRIVSKGAVVHAIGGIEDHVHTAVSVPPSIQISEWIGDLKGASAYHINHEVARRRLLVWQSGYGVVSFGTRDLEWVVRYIERQAEHHRNGTVRDRLEWIFSRG
jgi:REP element-mobilizing transposase RayT